jgi:UDP-N-acetylglucosamine--N-acetylmuramyl-(pentapeptide) pyrophosphoryl-undecaprenol N-acetylglucosamine transferase
VSAAPKIVIAAGGTAGHVVPALAVADALRAEGAEVAFIGGGRAEAQLVPAAGYPLHRLRVEGLNRSSPLRALRAAGLAALALPRAAGLLRTLGAEAVMGGGGYVAGPVGVAALALRLPLVLTEADSHLGLTNRLLAPFSQRVCLSFPLKGRDGERYRVTGRPIPPPLQDRAAARARFGLADEERCLLVFGGSLGARTINLATIEAFAAAPFRVLHISGVRDYPALASHDLRPGYELLSYLDHADFGLALAAADLVVGRAGGSVFELAAYGLPAILIPFPRAAGDHQKANARWMAEAGAATVIDDAELTAARLGGEVAGLLADEHRLRTMAAAARELARPRAAADVAGELLAAAGR